MKISMSTDCSGSMLVLTLLNSSPLMHSRIRSLWYLGSTFLTPWMWGAPRFLNAGLILSSSESFGEERLLLFLLFFFFADELELEDDLDLDTLVPDSEGVYMLPG